MHEVRVGVEGVTLVGTYSPAGSTAIVAVHGAGEGTRDWYLYRHLHDLLPPAGVGVLTFDRRGEGDSGGAVSRGRFAQQADDVLAFAGSIDADRVGLWGISQGGWVAPLAASRSERVSFLVLLASVGVTPAEQMRYATSEQLRRAGFGDETVDRALRLRARAERWIRDGDDTTGLQAEIDAAAREPWWELVFLPDTLPSGAEAEVIRAELAAEMFFAPEPIFSEVRVPTLLFYGDDDAWAPVGASTETWRRARDGDVEIVVLEGTGHEPTLRDGTISKDYEGKLVEWLRAHHIS